MEKRLKVLNFNYFLLTLTLTLNPNPNPNFNTLILSVPDELYSRNALCTLNLISTQWPKEKIQKDKQRSTNIHIKLKI
jgi:hypothetical protein